MIENGKQIPNEKEIEALTLFIIDFIFYMMKFLMKISKLKNHTLGFIGSEKYFRYLKRFLTMNQLKNI